MAVKNTRKQTSYGYPNPQANLFPDPIVASRAPAATDFGEVGQEWVDSAAGNIYFLVSISAGAANWLLMEAGGGAGIFTSLTVNPGPISLTGTTTINTIGGSSTTIGNAATTTAVRGTVNINTTGVGDTSIGTGGTGIVDIGNAVGTTFVTGLLTTQALTTVGITHINSAGTATTSIGNTTGNTAVTGTLNVSGDFSTTDGNVSVGNQDVAANAGIVQFLKDRGAGPITSGDDLGSVIFAGFDGTGFTAGASIVSTSSGTVAAGRVAGNLQFYTHPDAVTAPVLRMNISAAGNVTMPGADAGNSLTVSGATNAIFAPAGDITVGDGDVNINTPGKGINLPGPIQIITGAGVPGAGLALNAGDLYINTTPTGANDRLFIATGAGAWTFFAANA